MRRTFDFERLLRSDADRAWAVLAKLDAVNEWAPIIVECRIEGSGAGAVRHCVTADGNRLREKILAVDESTRSVHYVVEEGLPVEEYRGIFSIVQDAGQAKVRWHIEAEGQGDALGQVEAMLAQVAPAMLDGLDDAALRVK